MAEVVVDVNGQEVVAAITRGSAMQVHPAALPLDLIDLALAVLLEGQDLHVLGESLEGSQ